MAEKEAPKAKCPLYKDCIISAFGSMLPYCMCLDGHSYEECREYQTRLAKKVGVKIP